MSCLQSGSHGHTHPDCPVFSMVLSDDSSPHACDSPLPLRTAAQHPGPGGLGHFGDGAFRCGRVRPVFPAVTHQTSRLYPYPITHTIALPPASVNPYLFGKFQMFPLFLTTLTSFPPIHPVFCEIFRFFLWFIDHLHRFCYTLYTFAFQQQNLDGNGSVSVRWNILN